MKQSLKLKNSLCKLCSSPTGNEAEDYCCSGCRTVYHILSSQGNLKNFESSTLFQEAVKHGIISNPKLKEKYETLYLDEKEKFYFEIEDMWCPSCAEVIVLILKQLKGVLSSHIDFTTDLGWIEFEPRYLSKEKIFQTISSLGYSPKELSSEEKKTAQTDLLLRFGIAAFCSINTMMFSYPVYASYFSIDSIGYTTLFAWITFFTSLPIMTYCAKPIFQKGLTALFVGILGMEFLVTLGVFSAFFLSLYHLLTGGNHIYFDSMSVIVTFVLLGKFIESKAKFSAKESLLHLTKALPKRGRDVNHKFISLKEFKKGETLIVCCGEKIVLDGEIIEGEGLINEAVISGESYPKRKTVGDSVRAGSLLENGWIALRITTTYKENTLKKIVDMVQEGLEQKRAPNPIVDTFSKAFIPTIIILAFSIFVWDHNTESALRAISMILIACPCAIGIAAPLAESYLMYGMAKLGAIVKNRHSLLLLDKINLYIFDKTGTITKGNFSIQTDLEKLSKIHQSILKGLANRSNHPISITIAKSIASEPINLESVREYPGKGIEGFYDNCRYLLGSHRFLNEKGIKAPSASVLFAEDETLLISIEMEDQLREESKAMIQALHMKTLLLSGDREETVQKVAHECHFDGYFSEHSPKEKKELIENFKNEQTLCMVGDGVNDAPALSAADVSISVFSATDISVHTSDIQLTTDNLTTIPKIHSLAIKGQRIIKQNLFWAFSYNIVGVFLAACGYLNPLYSACAMVLSSIIVIYNSSRIT